MMKIKRGEAVLEIDAGIYSKESLDAATVSLSDRLRTVIRKAASGFGVAVKGASKTKEGPAAVRELAGEFLNESLNHEYRRRVIEFNGPITKPMLARVFHKLFFNVPKDPLEQLEPQVREDRMNETLALQKEARKLLDG